jgi:hypothetical protein
MWWRATVCYRKIDGKWMITHEHASVPFNVESGKASLDLTPWQFANEIVASANWRKYLLNNREPKIEEEI